MAHTTRWRAACAAAVLAFGLSAGQAWSQGVGGLPTPPTAGQQTGEMVLQADMVTYDNDRDLVIATGGVQIAYNGQTIQANRVTYNRQTRRLTAEGGVRIADTRGDVYHAESVDLSEDFRDGFVRTLRLERAADRTRFSADSATRRPDEVTVFERGTYTACEPCRRDPSRPPLWQVRAQRIIHNQQEQMLYFESGFLEFFGVPIAWVPYFWTPDGTVKRQSGFLIPSIVGNSRVGTGISVPYHLALSPFYDLTVTPTWYTDQGLHVSADWRHQLPFGQYRVRLSGIFQQNPERVGVGINTLDPTLSDPGAREFRGGFESVGQFRLTERWRFGWDVAADTDRRYFSDYGFMPWGRTERVSQLYLTGQGTRSFFETRLYHFRTFVTQGFADQQTYMPLVTPVTDYATALADPFLGGEIRLGANFTHLSRLDGFAYRFLDQNNNTLRWLTPGFAGDYSRLSLDLQWRRTLTDPIGQRWTPMLRFRADAYNFNPSNRNYATVDITSTFNFVNLSTAPATDILPDFFRQSEQNGIRAMPMVGLDYRFPFIAATQNASHIVEPIAQVILRPNETRIGQLPNEDAQSLVFDDTNLFATSKFSGYDRIEGGSRANFGIQYSFQSHTGFLMSALFGQSFHLSGINSFARGANDLTGVGLDSGLETQRSDYVARLHVQPWTFGDMTARFRFDDRDFSLRRMDVSGTASLGPATLTAGYTFIAPQPNIGFLTDREEINVGATLRLSQNWSVSASGRYSLQNSQNTPGWVQNGLAIRYADECCVFSVDYQRIYAGYFDLEPQQRIMARITLRTLGDFNIRAQVGNPITN